MVLFSGTASGREDFYSIEATDGFDLCLKLFPTGCRREDIPTRYRMWVKCPTATTSATDETYWADVCLQIGNNNGYKAVVEEALKLEGPVKVIIRGAKDSSPNSSPVEQTGTKLKTPTKFVVQSPGAIETTQSNLTASTVGISPVSSETITDRFKTFGISGASNIQEPFTLLHIGSEEGSGLTLIPLSFQKKQKRRVVMNDSVVLVDQAHLICFVKSQLAKGVGPLDMCLKDVKCNGGSTKNFFLTSDVWIGSMLPRSRYFRSVFTTAGCVEACRTAALKELKTEAPRLFDHLLFWVEDMQSFEEEAQLRLDTRFEATGVCKLMSPYYFTEVEARYLGDFFIPGSTTTLKDMLDGLVESGKEICTKNDVVPVLERTFKIPNKRQKNDHKEKRAAWLKEARLVIRKPMYQA